jgi:peptide/nickel transport system permease protein
MAQATMDAAIVEPKRRPYIVELFLRLLLEKPLGTFGLAIFFLLLVTGIFADQLAMYPMNKIDLTATLAGPTQAHILGTDNLGRDILSNLIYGARVSMIIGVVSTLISLVLSIIIGVTSATIGGAYDMIMQRFVDAWMCIPGMFILLIMMSILGRGLIQMIAAMSIPGGIGGSRMMRGLVFQIQGNAYLEAERGVGCSTGQLILKHILPNIAPMILLGACGMIGGMIMMESGLSFLGYGVPPGTPSWGSMLSMEGRQYMEIAPALAFWPGFCLMMVILGTNVFADAARDLLDPKQKGGASSSYAGPTDKQLKQLKKAGLIKN